MGRGKEHEAEDKRSNENIDISQVEDAGSYIADPYTQEIGNPTIMKKSVQKIAHSTACDKYQW